MCCVLGVPFPFKPRHSITAQREIQTHIKGKEIISSHVFKEFSDVENDLKQAGNHKAELLAVSF